MRSLRSIIRFSLLIPITLSGQAQVQRPGFGETVTLEQRPPIEFTVGSFRADLGSALVTLIRDEQSFDLVSFDVDFSPDSVSAATRQSPAVVTRQQIADGAIFALSRRILEYRGHMFTAFVQGAQLTIASRSIGADSAKTQEGHT